MSQTPMPLGVALRQLPPVTGEALVALAHRLCDAAAQADAQGLGQGVHGGRVALHPDSFDVQPDGSFTLRPGAHSADERPGYRTWSAPEQVGPSQDGDARAWVFSIAAILFEAATGDALFEAASPPAVHRLVLDDLDGHLLLTGARGRLRAAHPHIAAPLIDALASDPAGRPADLGALSAALPAVTADGVQDLLVQLESALPIALAQPAPTPRAATPPAPPTADEPDGLGGQSAEVSLEPRPPRSAAEPSAAGSEKPTLVSTMAPPPAMDSRVRPQSQLGRRVRAVVRSTILGAIGLALLALIGGTVVLFAFRDALPPEAQTRVEDTWDGLVAQLPDDIQVKLRRSVDPRAELSWLGEPVADGILLGALVTLEPPGTQPVLIDIAHAGSGEPPSGTIRWSATPAADPREPALLNDLQRVEGPNRPVAASRTPVSSKGLTGLDLPVGFWDVQLTIEPSSLVPPLQGTVRGLRVSPAFTTRIAAELSLPVGALAIQAQVAGEPAPASVTLYSPAAGDAVRKRERTTMQTTLDSGAVWHASAIPVALAESAPLWTGPATDIPALPTGPITARVAVDDGTHHPSVTWLRNVPIPTGGQTVSRTARLIRDEPLSIAGPGLRVRARNLKHDVSAHTLVLAFKPGGDVAVAQGRAGVFFAVPAGNYEVAAVYEPPAAGLGVRGERRLPPLTVLDAGVTEATIDIGFPAARVRIAVLDNGIDVSEDVEVRIMRAGVDRVAGTPIVDEPSVGEHVLPANTYDIYLVRSKPGTPDIDAAFPGVALAAGDVWERELDVASQPWATTEAAP